MTLLEVPIGFTLAMSCVLANRVVLNVRRAGQVVNLTESRKPMTGQEHDEHDGSSCSRGALSRHEMVQLRSMRSDHQLTDMVKSHSGWVAGLCFGTSNQAPHQAMASHSLDLYIFPTLRVLDIHWVQHTVNTIKCVPVVESEIVDRSILYFISCMLSVCWRHWHNQVIIFTLQNTPSYWSCSCCTKVVVWQQGSVMRCSKFLLYCNGSDSCYQVCSSDPLWAVTSANYPMNQRLPIAHTSIGSVNWISFKTQIGSQHLIFWQLWASSKFEPSIRETLFQHNTG